MLELPGGGIEKHETPIKSAKRELLEETGYLGKIKFVGITYEHGNSNYVRHNFVATECIKAKSQNLDSLEFIDVVEMNLNKFRQFLKNGNSTDIQTGYLCLDYLKLL